MKIKTILFGREEEVEVPSIIWDEFKKQKETFENWIYPNEFIFDLIDDSDGKIINKKLAEFLIRYETEIKLCEEILNSFNKQMEFKINDSKIKIHAFGQNSNDEHLCSIYLIGYVEE